MPRSDASSTFWIGPGQLDNTIIFYCADNGASAKVPLPAGVGKIPALLTSMWIGERVV